MHAPHGRAALLVLAAALLVFTFLAGELAFGGWLVATADPAVAHWLAVRRSEPVTGALMALTQSHGTVGIDLMLACAALYVGVMRRQWAAAVWLVAAVESSMLLNVVLKTAFARHRPDVDVPLVHLGTASFPSGHALASTALWACTWLLLPPGAGRTVTGIALALLVALVCFSRVYLGAHFLTDVLAGACEGLACAAAWSLALPRVHPPGLAGHTGASSIDHQLPTSRE